MKLSISLKPNPKVHSPVHSSFQSSESGLYHVLDSAYGFNTVNSNPLGLPSTREYVPRPLGQAGYQSSENVGMPNEQGVGLKQKQEMRK